MPFGFFFLLKLASSDSQRASAFHLDPPDKNIKPYAQFVASKGHVPACVFFPRGPGRHFPQNEGLTERLLEAGIVFAADFSAPLFFSNGWLLEPLREEIDIGHSSRHRQHQHPWNCFSVVEKILGCRLLWGSVPIHAVVEVHKRENKNRVESKRRTLAKQKWFRHCPQKSLGAAQLQHRLIPPARSACAYISTNLLRT